jgi:murein DD-endopeptidase MepM/ murein hydrolase activator NlpD
MKIVRSFLIVLVALAGTLLICPPTHSSVSPEELGRMLLASNYSGITQQYDVYYKDGPTGPTTKGGWHPGIDYRAQTPLPVYSPVNGVVDSSDREGTGFGRVSVKIDQTNDYFIFLHLSKLSVRNGQTVRKGDPIGKTGSTGAPAPHLHVEVRIGRSAAAYYFKSKNDTGVNQDPSSVINR